LRVSQQQSEAEYSPLVLPRSVVGLHDIVLVHTPDGGLAHPDFPAVALSADQLADHARPGTTDGRQLRLLVDDGARHEGLLGRVADLLACDVIVAPAGASVGLLPGPDGLTGEAVPVDRASGEIVDWRLIQPTSLATPLPGWFDLVGGLVLARTGLATLPLADGVEFVDRESFVRRRAAAAGLGVGHPDLVTVAVATGDKGFRLPGYESGNPAVRAGYSGQDLAAALAELELYGGDVRLWLRWPDDPARQHRTAIELAAFAETTGATVWAPAAGGEAVLLRGCQDLGVRDRSGNVTRWQEYRPPYVRAKPKFTTDLDGRLVPAAGPTAGRVGAVTMVSTARQPGTAPQSRYAGLTAEPGVAMLELSRLGDGRLAMQYADGSRLALGGRALRALLVDLGWVGEDLQLLTPVPPDAAEGLHTHLAALEGELGVELWSLPPDASVLVQDGPARAVDQRRRPVGWWRAGQPDPGRPDRRWHTVDGYLVPVHRDAPRPNRPAPTPPPAAPAAAAPPPERPLPAPSPYQVAASDPDGLVHGVEWIPQGPLVNTDPVRLWISCPWPPGRAAVEGVPAANLFLTGQLDGVRVARTTPGEHLLCLQVDAGCAIDLSRIDEVPSEVRRRFGATADLAGCFLLPAAWLDQVRLVAGYPVDGDGRPGDPVELPGEPVSLRCADAEHGVDGLPDEVVRWPGDGLTGQVAWVLLPEEPGAPVGDCLEAWLQPPPVRVGHRLASVRLDAGAAVDVPASAASLAGLVSVRSRLPDLLVSGVDLLLPSASYDRARVDLILYADGGRWQPQASRVDLPLSALFEPDLPAAAQPAR
jgi:hypothetical protein